MRRVLLVAVVLVGASLLCDAVVAQDMLIEGFENIAHVKVTGGKISAAAAGSGGVTEGKQAASIPSGASLAFTISVNNCRRYDWLKFDTLTLQPLAHRFFIEAKGKKLSLSRYCYAESGKDTLALPLSWLVAKLRGRWPGGKLRIVLTSAGDAGVIVDNVRLTLAAAPPEDCVLQDFGGDKQLVWPGFERAGAESEHVVWSVLNALRLRAANLTAKLTVGDSGLRRDLKTYPARLATGPTVFNLEGAFWRLGTRGVKPGTRRYQTAVTAAVKRTDSLARRAGLRWFFFYVGSGNTAEELDDIAKRASSVRSAGGSATAWVYVKAIREMPEKDRHRVLAPFASLIFVPDGPDLAKSIALFKSLGRDKGAYVYLTRPGRYGAGLFAAASGADGVFCAGVAPGRPLYNGFGFNGRGVLALQPDKSLTPTLAMFALRQGVRDFLLVKRCEALLARADKAKVSAFGLDNDLAELRGRVARDVGPGFDRRLTRSANMTPSEIQAWRVRLILAAGETARKLKGK